MLGRQSLEVQCLTEDSPHALWKNTFGIWGDELEVMHLTKLLEYRWGRSLAYFGKAALPLVRHYGLFDKKKFQQHLLANAKTVTWCQGKALQIRHFNGYSAVRTSSNKILKARIVIDCTGHFPVLVKRPGKPDIAYQSAYGIIGHFSAPPVEDGQFVLMDYRSEHLTKEERKLPPTFSYEMDFGDGVYFVEETSLACAPAVSFEVLEKRLQKRLAHRGIQVEEVHHVERCLFPMNAPLPYLDQPVLGFGGAASMVHPASGYMVGAMLRRAPVLAEAIAQALQDPKAGPHEIARAGWNALWDKDHIRKHYLYLFGLEALMGFEEERLKHHFETFFRLPQESWSGFLADTLTTPELIRAMMGMFAVAPNDVRWGLMKAAGSHRDLLWKALRAEGSL